MVLCTHLMHHSPNYVFIAHRLQIPVVRELHDFHSACERAHLQRPGGELCGGPDGGAACAAHCFPEQSAAVARWSARSHAHRRALEETDELLCPSEFVADYFRRVFGLKRELRVLGNAVSLPAPVPGRRTAPVHVRRPDGPLNLVSVGVVVPHKGIHVAIEALRLAGLEEVSYTLVGATTEPYLQELRLAASRVPGLKLRAYGRFELSELPMLLEESDAVLVPSLVWETYSIVTREAFACGVPVIAARRGALGEAVREGENGLLFDPGRPAELAVILSDLSRERDRLDRLRRGIRPDDWITAEARAGELAEILEQVCARGRAGYEPDSEERELVLMREALRSYADGAGLTGVL